MVSQSCLLPSRISAARYTHVRTSPFYPQTNGKLERWHQSLKRESIRPRCPLSLEDARQIVTGYVEHYNTRRLHSALGYITPADKLAGREKEILAVRDGKPEAARQQRQVKRQAANTNGASAEAQPDLTNQAVATIIATSRETDASSAEEQPAEG